VEEEIRRHFVPLKINATAPSDPMVSFMKTSGVVGLPTILFLDPQGKPLADLTVNRFVDAEELLGILATAVSRSSRKAPSLKEP
jgi:thiol:disulfide interchange protein